MADPEILSLEGMSALTGIPVNTHRYYRATDQGPRTFRLGRRVVAYKADVIDWLNEQRAADAKESA